jgi:hypothetical protein
MVQTSLRRVLLVAVLGSAAFGAGALVTAAPASATLCVEGRVWLNGSVTPAGTCLPVMDQWEAPCSGFDLFPLGHGAGATACVPTPV